MDLLDQCCIPETNVHCVSTTINQDVEGRQPQKRNVTKSLMEDLPLRRGGSGRSKENASQRKQLSSEYMGNQGNQ